LGIILRFKWFLEAHLKKKSNLKNMKYLLITVAFLFFTQISYAQLPDSTIAPNFTLQDIDGNSHTLYDYLDSGKTVVINISSTAADQYAGQSWLYFSEFHLNSIYTDYGPSGTDEIMVLMLETDPSTPLSGLYGEGSTLGDWEQWANFPIIHNDSIGDVYPYGIMYPSSYIICPNRRTTWAGWITANSFPFYFNQCGTPDFNNNAAIKSIDSPGLNACGSLQPSITVENFGFNPLQSLNISYQINDETPELFLWEGNISMYTSKEITLPTIDVNIEGDHVFNVRLVETNQVSDEDTTDNQLSKDFAYIDEGQNIRVEVTTDANPDDVIWRIRETTDVILTVDNYDQMYHHYNHNFCLEAGACYTFDVFDLGNDGMQEGSIGEVLLIQGEDTVVHAYGDEYGADFTTEFCINQVGFEQNTDGEDKVKVYPNPATEHCTVQVNSNDYSLKIVDLAGQIKKQIRGTQYQTDIDISDLSTGFYFMVISLDSNQLVHKLVVE